MTPNTIVFSSDDLAARIAAFQADGEVDVLIIGAGVNGVGLFRDLAMQGLKCLLVDKNDYGSGTSAAPTRLIHGGLKYLETGEFRLVAQSTLERNLLLVNAPHYVKPLPTIMPIFSWGKGFMSAACKFFGGKATSSNRGALLVKMGLMLYDFYGRHQRVMPRHVVTGRAASLRDFPGLNPNIVATATYFDAAISHPERLIWEMIEDALNANPHVLALNHSFLEQAEHATSPAHLTWHSPLNACTLTVKPKIVVNATGPWIDKVNALLKSPSHFIGGTKGSHILLNHPQFFDALNGRMLYFETADGRICLSYPYLGYVLVGATDIKADNPDDVHCEETEIDYFFDSLQKILPSLSFSREQIISTYSGIRPLPVSDAKDPGLISRDHAAPILEPDNERPFPIYSLVGGKWTTFRGFAEEVADMLLQRLGKSRKSSTRHLAIGGGHNYPKTQAERDTWIANLAREKNISQQQVTQLFARYGTRACLVAQHISTVKDDAPLIDAPDYSSGEMDYLIQHEQVRSLADLVLRRTTLALTGKLTARLVGELATQAAHLLRWDDARRRNEIATLTTQLKHFHHIDLDVTAS